MKKIFSFISRSGFQLPEFLLKACGRGGLLVPCSFCFAPYCFSQNTGIGTTTPTEKLHVAGNIKADTVKPNAIKLTPNAGTGKILTSDADGNANWLSGNMSGGVGFGGWGDCATNGNIGGYQPVADTGVTGDPASDWFGGSVFISGNYAIVGIEGDDVGANAVQGSVNIYQFDGDSWVLMQKITDADGAAGDRFGCSVSISGNYAIVGARTDDVGINPDQGSASIYQRTGNTWVLMQKITDATGAAGDYFGYSVSISGNFAFVGAIIDDVGVNANQGSVSIFKWNGSAWVLAEKIVDNTGEAGDNFGAYVSMDGNFAIVGATGDNVGANADQGSVSFYRTDGLNWFFMQKITDATGAAGDNFGYSVSISGNYALVGAPYDDVGVNADQGSVSFYRTDGLNWFFTHKITDATGAAGDHFGYSVSISGNNAIAGSEQDDVTANNNEGSAAIYQRVGPGWQRLQKFTEPAGNTNNYFGFRTAIDGITKRFIVSAVGYENYAGKALFGKIN